MLRLIVVLIAIVAGGAAGWLALQATWRAPSEPATVVLEAPKVDVLTPAVNLMRGGRIDASQLAWSAWPAAQVGTGMILRQEQPDARETLAGRMMRSNLYAGEPIRAEHLAKSEAGFLALALQPGMRALGVQISDDKTAGGFVLPNDRVDVLHTVVRDIDGDGMATGVTRTILTNVRVLAIGQITFGKETLVTDPGAEGAAAPGAGGDATTLTGKTATLEVTGRQAEVLLAAAASGQLALALRAADDFGLSGIGDLQMIEGAAPVPPVATRTTDLSLQIGGKPVPHRREVTIISRGVPRTVVTGPAEQVDE